MAELYFAYGSNINLEQMACRCPDACVVGPVFLEDYESWALTLRHMCWMQPKTSSKDNSTLWQRMATAGTALETTMREMPDWGTWSGTTGGSTI